MDLGPLCVCVCVCVCVFREAAEGDGPQRGDAHHESPQEDAGDHTDIHTHTHTHKSFLCVCVCGNPQEQEGAAHLRLTGTNNSLRNT